MSEGARYDLKIILDGLSFLNSYWIVYSVNVEITNCHAASLVLNLNHLEHAIIQNCTFGNWTFIEVQNAFIKNCNIVFLKDISKSLKFFNSSVYMKNITMEHEIITGDKNGIFIQSYSLLHIEQSTFINNTVKSGIIKTLSSSTLIMSNCTVLENHAKYYAGVIYAKKGFVHLKNTYFNGNMAIDGGGAILIWIMSFLQIKNCTFINNSVDRTSGVGGGIMSLNSSLVDISHSLFDHNKAHQGGAIYQETGKMKLNQCSFFRNYAKHTGGAVAMSLKSILCVLNTTFISNLQISTSTLNTSQGGGAIHLSNSVGNISKSTFQNNVAVVTGGAIRSENCSLNIEYSTFQNDRVSDQVKGRGGGMFLYGNSTIKISNVLFSKCYACYGGAIGRFANFTTITMSNSSLIANTGTAILLVTGDTLDINYSTFFNNTSPRDGGAILCEVNCVVKMASTTFGHNRARGVGGAVIVSAYNKKSKDKRMSNLTVLNCTFTDNTAFGAGAMAAFFSIMNIVNSNFLQNLATEGGAVVSTGNLIMKNCYTSNNTTLQSAGVIFTENGTLLMSNCLVFNNTSNGDGGALVSKNSEVVFANSIFETNRALGFAGVLQVFGGTIHVRNSSFTKNFARISGGVLSASRQTVINNITQSFCIENEAGYSGGVIWTSNTKIIISDTNISYNSGNNCGAIYMIKNSILEIDRSKIEGNNAALQIGALYIFGNSLFIAVNSSFKGNTANDSSSILIDNSTAYLEKCNFSENRLTYGGTITTLPGTMLKISNTVFTKNEGYDIANVVKNNYFITKFETYRCLFMHGNISLKSNVKHFEQVAVKEKIIGQPPPYVNQSFFKVSETVYASSKMYHIY